MSALLDQDDHRREAAAEYGRLSRRLRRPWNSSVRRALHEYQGTGYVRINTMLRDPSRNHDDEYAVRDRRAIDRAFEWAPRLPQGTRLWRGVGHPWIDRLEGSLERGEWVVEAGFLSTTRSRAVAEGFAKAALLELDVAEAIPALCFQSLDRNVLNEREVLLPRDCRLHIDDVSDYCDVTVVRARVHPPETSSPDPTG